MCSNWTPPGWAGSTKTSRTSCSPPGSGVPVCPHAGGVGLCELVQHFSFFDYAAVSGSQEGRMIEYVDHLHEHFAEPVRIVNGRYAAPQLPGTGAEMLSASRSRWEFPGGAGWQEVGNRAAVTGV